MRGAIRVGVLAVIFAMLQAQLPSTQVTLPVPELETLPNGLTIAWFVNDALPVVDLALLIRSGSRDDQEGKSGTADLLARTLDRGADGMNAREIARAVEMLGASRYATAEDDAFTVGLHGLAPDAPALLALLAKVALRPEFPEAEILRERARASETIAHLEDYGEALAGLAFNRFVRNGTSYARGSIRSLAEFQKLGRADLRAFHQKHFVPDNALLLVVGRVKKEEFRKKVAELFGGWKSGEPAGVKRAWKEIRDPRFVVPVAKSAKKNAFPGEVLVLHRPNLPQAQLRLGVRAPVMGAPDHYALVVGNALLGETFNSRLNALLRDQLGLTYSIGSSFSYQREFATFSVASATQTEQVGEVLGRTLGVLDGLREGAIPEDEVRGAKEYLTGVFPLGTATLGAVALRWLTGWVYGLGPDYLNEFVPSVNRVSAPEVQAAMKRLLDPAGMIVVISGDAPQIEKSLAKAGYSRVRRLSLKDLI